MRGACETAPCFSCGAVVPVTDGPTHDYMLSSPGCWKVFGEVLAREYQDAAYTANHRLTVDAYAVQHPGDPTPAAIRSVTLHLASLCAVLEHGVSPARATRLLQTMADVRLEADWLEPPRDLGAITVADVHATDDAEEHLAAVERWARSAWEAWAPHHYLVRRRVATLVGDGR